MRQCDGRGAGMYHPPWTSHEVDHNAMRHAAAKMVSKEAALSSSPPIPPSSSSIVHYSPKRLVLDLDAHRPQSDQLLYPYDLIAAYTSCSWLPGSLRSGCTGTFDLGWR